ncbi:MAG TPA: hypothetical protein VKC17_12055 [Sphingomicrobium sp.]|nr:hypothetical protein [Sphingomicrobium sp.]
MLDPACGTGNFVYVAMARMKELGRQSCRTKSWRWPVLSSGPLREACPEPRRRRPVPQPSRARAYDHELCELSWPQRQKRSEGIAEQSSSSANSPRSARPRSFGWLGWNEPPKRAESGSIDEQSAWPPCRGHGGTAAADLLRVTGRPTRARALRSKLGQLPARLTSRRIYSA